MAKIAIISQFITPQTLSLAQALFEQRNEVLLVTSRNEAIPGKSPYQILTPFKNFSAVEALRFLPRLLAHKPDIVHIVYSHEDENPSAAHLIIGNAFHAFASKITVCSFFHSPKSMQKWKAKYLLSACDLVTYSSRDHLLYGHREFGKKTPMADVLPPLDPVFSEGAAAAGEDLKRLCQSLGQYFVIPSDPESFFKSASKSHIHLALKNKFNLLFLGQRPQSALDLEYFTLDNLKPEELQYVVENSKGALLAFSDLSLIELQKYLQWSLETNTPLFVRPAQIEMLPGLVLDKKTGWILEAGEKSLEQVIADNPQLRLPPFRSHDRKYELMDSTLNEINRLYSKAFQFKSNRLSHP
ncbi:MAG: hypothetical protein BroJett040_20610 [Oligoflexia bacterium]|nr:MAG: hypothetical protein BroJett040_20610 [Oligoflexia bacterium]